MGLAVRDVLGHCVLLASDWSDTAPSAPRTALLTMPMCGLTRQCASSAQSETTLVSEQIGHRDRPFDRLDDVGQADVAARPGEREAAAGAADAGQQAGGGELAHQFLRGWKRHAGFGGELGRAQARGGGPRRAAAVIRTTA